MNPDMSYLLGMVFGNGEIQRNNTDATISITIPYRKLSTEDISDVRLFVKASIADIKNSLEPLIGSQLSFVQNNYNTVLTFSLPNSNYLIREILRFMGQALSHLDATLNPEIFNFTTENKLSFLKGFADVTAYIRRSNYYFNKYKHRVYIEIPNNWYLVADICNLLKSVNVPVQDINWAHPNMRDGNLKKYNLGNASFWKKEHQIKIWANEFLKIGFGVMHKQQALEMYSEELVSGFESKGINPQSVTHKYYWDFSSHRLKIKPKHPSENDPFIPSCIRNRHYDSWTEIAKDLGYVK